MNALELHLLKLIDKKCQQVQIGLRGAPAPIGPGRVEAIPYTVNPGDAPVVVKNLYQVLVEAHIPVPSSIQGMPPAMVAVTLPMVFDPEQMLFLTEGPVNEKGEAVVITNPRSSGPAIGVKPKSGLQIG